MVINENKSIGTVIFIVEGQHFEFSIIDRIFTKIFHYEYHEKRRGKSKYLNKGRNPLSRVFVMNAESSNLNSISNEKYLDNLYEELDREFGVNIDDAAIFFIFDRDPKSNTKDNMESDVDNELKYGLGNELKQFIASEENRNIQLNKMSLGTIEHATKEFINFINEANIMVDIDDLSKVPLHVYNLEEEIYEQHSVYRVLSLLTIAFIQLGMVVLEDGDVENYIERTL